MSAGCRNCGHGYIEEWAKDKDAVRCGNRDNGERCMRVVDIIPKGRNGIAREDAPKWCVLTERNEL